MSLFENLGVGEISKDKPDPMDPYKHFVPEVLPWDLLQGDALTHLKTLPDHSFDGCYCDPPYGLSDRNRIRAYEKAKRDLTNAFDYSEGSHACLALDFEGVQSSDCGLTFDEEGFECLVYHADKPELLQISRDLSQVSLSQDFSAWQRDLISEGNLPLLHLTGLECEDDSNLPHLNVLPIYLDLGRFERAFKSLPSGGFMGRGWDSDVPSVEVWREVLRVLKPGAMLMAFGGSRVWHRLAVNIEDAGFEIRDSVAWIYSQGFPKALDISKSITSKMKTGKANSTGMRKLQMGEDYVPSGRGRVNYDNGGGSVMNGTPSELELADQAKIWEGYKTALKPAHEPVVVAMKPLDGNFAENALEHGVAGFNIEGSRIGKPFVSQGGNNYEAWREGESRTDRPSSHGNATSEEVSGRYPTNVVFSHTPECNERACEDTCQVSKLDGQSGELTSGTLKKRDVKDASVTTYGDGLNGFASQDFEASKGGASRFYYCAKSCRSEREAGLVPEEGQARANLHPAVKPLDLNRYLSKMILPPERDSEPRKLLIPFSGSGSEMIGALKAGWDHVTGIEMQSQHVKVAHQRLLWWTYGGGCDD